MKRKYGVIRNLSKQEFAQLVANSKTVADLLKSLNMYNSTGNHRTIWKRIKQDGLDGSHFPSRGMKGFPKTKEHKLKLSLSKISKHGITPKAYKKALTEGKKWCSGHKTFLASTDFSKGERVHYCKSCAHDQNLKRVYRVPIGWYRQQLDKQHGSCAICNESSLDGSNLYVDHDHGCCPNEQSCGKCVRGLVCNSCNIMLGHIENNLDVTHKAFEYLIRYKENNA